MAAAAVAEVAVAAVVAVAAGVVGVVIVDTADNVVAIAAAENVCLVGLVQRQAQAVSTQWHGRQMTAHSAEAGVGGMAAVCKVPDHGHGKPATKRRSQKMAAEFQRIVSLTKMREVAVGKKSYADHLRGQDNYHCRSLRLAVGGREHCYGYHDEHCFGVEHETLGESSIAGSQQRARSLARGLRDGKKLTDKKRRGDLLWAAKEGAVEADSFGCNGPTHSGY